MSIIVIIMVIGTIILIEVLAVGEKVPIVPIEKSYILYKYGTYITIMRNYNVKRVEIKMRVQDTRLSPSSFRCIIRHLYNHMHCFEFIIER